MTAKKKWPGWLGAAQGEIERDLHRETLARVAIALRDEIERAGLIDTGRLWRSVRVDESKGTLTMVPYEKFVEFGRKPGGKMPPVKVLQVWVRRKLGITDKREVRNVAWVISAKIKREGIPATNVLARAWKRVLR